MSDFYNQEMIVETLHRRASDLDARIQVDHVMFHDTKRAHEGRMRTYVDLQLYLYDQQEMRTT